MIIWLPVPINSLGKQKSFEIFGTTVKDFYVKVEAYIGQTNADVVPTDDLSLGIIFYTWNQLFY